MGEMTVLGDFSERVKEKIKRDFAGMIPDGAWDKLVADAVKNFIERDLAAFVKKELEVEIKSRLAKFFESPAWVGDWDYNASPTGQGVRVAGEKVREIISENIPRIVNTVLGSSVQAIIQEMSYRLGR